MNPTTLTLAKSLFVDIRKGFGKKRYTSDVIIAPPTPFITTLAGLSPSGRIQFGAQDVSYEKKGEHTGEVALSMLASVGVTHVIVGHSERRAAGETDEMVNKKALAVTKGKATAIVCVGEEKRDQQGNYFSIVESQLKAALKDFSGADMKRTMIAYEPVWAIGSGKTATAEDIEEMRLFIQKVIADQFDRAAANKMPILYGGSVHERNAGELLAGTGVQGFLIGGASLRATEFVRIIEAAESYAKTT